MTTTQDKISMYAWDNINDLLDCYSLSGALNIALNWKATTPHTKPNTKAMWTMVVDELKKIDEKDID